MSKYDEPIKRAECDTCDWTLTRNAVIRYVWNEYNWRPDKRVIRRTFSSLREGHAYFNRGHAPSYVYQTQDEQQEDSDAEM